MTTVGGAVAWMFEKETNPSEVWSNAMEYIAYAIPRGKAELNVGAAKAGLVDLKLPEMMMLEGGQFDMGSTELPNEKPPHLVKVPAFAIGKYEVTFDEWQVCVADGKCTNLPELVEWD